MNESRFRHVYGPVPSRRLGRSLGVDLVPFKVCTYDCVYCQLGHTTCKTLERKEYVPTAEVIAELKAALASGPQPDYIGLAGSGEPTLNSHIGEIIRTAKTLTQIPVAVITNGSLLWMPQVREDLMRADLVLPSLDAGDACAFRTINRPQKNIAFEQMMDGLAEFTRVFPGEVWLEVFLLAGMNDTPASLKNLADLVRHIAPSRLQLNTVSRPPSETTARALSPQQMSGLLATFSGKVEIVGDGLMDEPVQGAPREIEDGHILALLGRRPCTLEDVAQGLSIHRMEALKHLEHLMATGKAGMTISNGRHYFTVAIPEARS